ncbi:hypothetical protein QL285_053793 [Trifolium repens]|nr:hypothetical protein QL285_053793 [Trifolium repens]
MTYILEVYDTLLCYNHDIKHRVCCITFNHPFASRLLCQDAFHILFKFDPKTVHLLASLYFNYFNQLSITSDNARSPYKFNSSTIVLNFKPTIYQRYLYSTFP